MYETTEEAKQKLEGSVVLYDNVPVFISSITGSKKKVTLYYKKIPLNDSDEPQPRDISDPLWDFRSAGTRLGYTQVLNPRTRQWESVFISRVPVRSSRQGLDSKTIQIFGDDSYNYSWSDVISRGEGLNRTVRNTFDPVEYAFRQITEDSTYKSVPIHRKLSLLYDKISPPYLLYRSEKVGYTEDGRTFKLAKHKAYLMEELVDMCHLKLKA